MNPLGQSHGLGYSDLIKVFSSDELEELLFGCPSSPSRSTTFWDWVSNSYLTPPSPPALTLILNTSSPFSYSEEVPEATMAFYTFIKGGYDPCLFVPDPFNYFLKEGTSSSIKPKQHHQWRKGHPYYLRPRDSNGQAITAHKLN
ncbi:hypothetical protein O181_131914 [Austropuccinia psidii MF-1]|uniref:Uncharacterized protein n=1 Tax=Austropuccinia psidii MF-1 TaxID=1389203 RepID=A0A9Q3L3W3_9BASI|nr:hypothetical protein [Austropuccinia psidii MF-1]